ncbi:hypothetical protein BMB171_C2507 [Bacillus thuringiensis BMB171]|nr:hypothetical protein BMB171_C2507 [Bacillus thuringiensis BMB171]
MFILKPKLCNFQCLFHLQIPLLQFLCLPKNNLTQYSHSNTNCIGH